METNLPVNYVRQMRFLPTFSQQEARGIEEKIEKTKTRVIQSKDLLKKSYNELTQIVAKILCCLAYFDLGQQYAKMAQLHYTNGDIDKGQKLAQSAEDCYKEADWELYIKQYYDEQKNGRVIVVYPKNQMP